MVEATKGVPPATAFNIPDLTVGERYYTRVSAANIVGYGATTDTLQTVGEGVVPMSVVVVQKPEAPSNVAASAISGSQFTLTWSNPVANGNAVTDYKVEWYSADADREEVVVTIENSVADTAGWFKLEYGGEITARINWNAEASAVKEALEDLKTLVSAVTVTRGEFVNNGYVWTVVFTSPGDQVDMNVSFTSSKFFSLTELILFCWGGLLSFAAFAQCYKSNTVYLYTAAPKCSSILRGVLIN